MYTKPILLFWLIKLSISACTTKWKTNTISVGPEAFKFKVLERKCNPKKKKKNSMQSFHCIESAAIWWSWLEMFRLGTCLLSVRLLIAVRTPLSSTGRQLLLDAEHMSVIKVWLKITISTLTSIFNHAVQQPVMGKCICLIFLSFLFRNFATQNLTQF